MTSLMLDTMYIMLSIKYTLCAVSNRHSTPPNRTMRRPWGHLLWPRSPKSSFRKVRLDWFQRLPPKRERRCVERTHDHLPCVFRHPP